MATPLGSFLGFLGGLLTTFGFLFRHGRIGRNLWFGMRIPTLLSDDRSWIAGHRAAGPWIEASGGIAIVTSVVLLAWQPSDQAASIGFFVGLAASTVLVAIATGKHAGPPSVPTRRPDRRPRWNDGTIVDVVSADRREDRVAVGGLGTPAGLS